MHSPCRSLDRKPILEVRRLSLLDHLLQIHILSYHSNLQRKIQDKLLLSARTVQYVGFPLHSKIDSTPDLHPLGTLGGHMKLSKAPWAGWYQWWESRRNVDSVNVVRNKDIGELIQLCFRCLIKSIRWNSMDCTFGNPYLNRPKRSFSSKPYLVPVAPEVLYDTTIRNTLLTHNKSTNKQICRSQKAMQKLQHHLWMMMNPMSGKKANCPNVMWYIYRWLQNANVTNFVIFVGINGSLARDARVSLLREFSLFCKTHTYCNG